MKTESELLKSLTGRALELGPYRAGIIPSEEVVTDASFRDACARNSCGIYGRCWTCPPDAGDIHELIASLKQYRHALIYQTVGELEDSFDFEGMQEAKKVHNRVTLELKKAVRAEEMTDYLVLGSGGCGVCETCAKRTDEPCRFPDLAFASLEAYGVFVSKTAEKAGMKYINGKDTVTYFGAVFFNT